MKDKLLLVLKVPPPVHGSTMMNRFVANSTKFESDKTVLKHLQSISNNTEDIGKISLKKIKRIIRNYVRLFKDLRNFQPDLVYFTLSPTGYAFLKDFISVLIVKYFKIPIIFHLHGKGISNISKHSNFFRLLYNFCFRNERAIVLSKYLKYDVEQFSLKNIYVVGNGIEDEAKNISLNNTKNEDFIITYLSNFIEEKGVLKFVDVLGRLSKKGINFKANIIGNPTDVSKDEILAKINECEIRDRIANIGPAYGQEKTNILNTSNIFVFPTFYSKECYPLVLLEAMQFGLPIITSSEGGIRDIVEHNENGFIIDPHNIDQMADRIAEIKCNPILYEKMSKSSREKFLNQHTVGQFEDNLNGVIDNVLNEIN